MTLIKCPICGETQIDENLNEYQEYQKTINRVSEMETERTLLECQQTSLTENYTTLLKENEKLKRENDYLKSTNEKLKNQIDYVTAIKQETYLANSQQVRQIVDKRVQEKTDTLIERVSEDIDKVNVRLKKADLKIVKSTNHLGFDIEEEKEDLYKKRHNREINNNDLESIMKSIKEEAKDVNGQH